MRKFLSLGFERNIVFGCWTFIISFFYCLLFSDSITSLLKLLFFSFIVDQLIVFICIWTIHGLYHYSKNYRNFWDRRTENDQTLLSFILFPPTLYLGYYCATQVFDWLKIDMSQFDTYKLFLINNYILCFAVVLLFTFLDRVFRSKEQKEALTVKVKNLEIEKLKTQLTALSLQMSPHFLFNILHSVTGSIIKDPQTAQKLTVELADLLRLILVASKKETHSINEELLICRLYLSLEKKRFGDKLQYQFEALEDKEIENTIVPVLILQPILENAIKHGFSARGRPLSIQVSFDYSHDLNITIKDDGQGFVSKAQGHSIGLENCRKRLFLVFGNKASITIKRESPWTKVLISIPKHVKGLI